ncbi:hypothetical protein [Nocardia altamirensis]|uniref:hypothetical protein n=1 Tax=Nocardia altamirensis TaxID=472158 RepID=UPI0008402B02|nr:hypothetical protein [Nocardia altamirensis]
MRELEQLLTEVRNPDARTLMAEAYRCYNAGAYRAAISSTWTAVTTDLIAKITQLADDGEGKAAIVRNQVSAAQVDGVTTEGVKQMQVVENMLLGTALELELIDSVGKRDLERIREDRNLSVHPSLRPYGEVFDPRPEVARAHLANALTILLVHPATQGRAVMDAYLAYTCDPGFVAEAVGHIQATFYDRVREAARRNIAKLAAKHALLELPAGSVLPTVYADRSAAVLVAFAQRDRQMVRDAVAAQAENFNKLGADAQLRGLARLADQDYFWDIIDDPLTERLSKHLLDMALPGTPESQSSPEVIAALATVSVDRARAQMPVLEHIFESLRYMYSLQMRIIELRIGYYFVPALLGILETVGNWRDAEVAGRLLVRFALGNWLRLGDLTAALDNWAQNVNCRTATEMPRTAVLLYAATSSLGAARNETFHRFLIEVRRKAGENDDSDHYRYPALGQQLAEDGYTDGEKRQPAS